MRRVFLLSVILAFCAIPSRASCSNTAMGNWTCKSSVSATSGGTSSTAQAAGSLTVANNDLLAVSCSAVDNGTATTFSLTNTGTASVGTWTSLAQANFTNHEDLGWSYAFATSAGTVNPTCNSTASRQFLTADFLDISNSGGLSSFDTNSQITGTSSGGCPCTITAASVTTAAANDLVLGAVANDAGVISVGSGTLLENANDFTEGQNQASSGAVSITASDNTTADAFSFTVMAFKPPGGGGTTGSTIGGPSAVAGPSKIQ
jgi:hypothetical protein